MMNFLCRLTSRWIRKRICRIYESCNVSVYGMQEFSLLAEKETCILTCWHHHVLLAAHMHNRLPPVHSVCFAEKHFCGRIAAGLFDSSKFVFVPLKRRDRALVEFIRKLSVQRSVGLIVPDGPLGPVRKAQPGVVMAAKKLNVKIVPFSWSASKCWCLPSWDKMQVPKVGSTLKILFGKPLEVAGLSLGEGVQALEQVLNDLEKEAKI